MYSEQLKSYINRLDVFGKKMVDRIFSHHNPDTFNAGDLEGLAEEILLQEYPNLNRKIIRVTSSFTIQKDGTMFRLMPRNLVTILAVLREIPTNITVAQAEAMVSPAAISEGTIYVTDLTNSAVFKSPTEEYYVGGPDILIKELNN